MIQVQIIDAWKNLGNTLKKREAIIASFFPLTLEFSDSYHDASYIKVT